MISSIKDTNSWLYNDKSHLFPLRMNELLHQGIEAIIKHVTKQYLRICTK